jgi:hypothetical protein
LVSHEKEEKKKYLEACLGQRRHFTPFMVSTDDLLGKEAKTLRKMKNGGSGTQKFVAMPMLIRALPLSETTQLCLRDSRVRISRMSNHRAQLEDKAGLSLFRHY